MIFTDDAISELTARYPRLTSDEIRSAASRVAQRHEADPLNNPLAYLDRALRSISERTPKLRPHPERSTNAPASRGSFAPDGSFDRSLAVASETERTLRNLAATIARANLSPAQAVDAVTASPLAFEAFRSATIEAMLMLEAKPQPNTLGSHSPADWVYAAWRCLHTSTSAEEFLKRSVLRALAPTA